MFPKRSQSPWDCKVKKRVSQFVPIFFKTFFHLNNKNKWLHSFRINFGVFFMCVSLVAVSSAAPPESFGLSSWGFVSAFCEVCLCVLAALCGCICLPLLFAGVHLLASSLPLLPHLRQPTPSSLTPPPPLCWESQLSSPYSPPLLHHRWAEEAAQKTWPERILTFTIISFKKLQLN